MRKFLFTLCMTMLCAVGAWAATIESRDEITAYTNGDVYFSFTYTIEDGAASWDYSINCQSDNTSICTVNLMGWNNPPSVTVTGVSAGSTDITLTLTKSGFTVVTKKVHVTVVAGTPPGAVLSKESDGTVVINFPQDGIWGGGENNSPNISSSSTATLNELKAATKVKVTGSISSSDIQEISYLIGDRYNAQENHPAQVLDMSIAQMTEPLCLCNAAGESTLCIRNIKTLYLPLACEGHTTVPVLSGWVGKETGGGSLEYLSITEGWTGISANAFASCVHLHDAYFPATLETIAEKAFYHCDTFSSIDMGRCTEVKTIGVSAFETEQALSDEGVGATKLVLPPNLETIEVNAFKCTSATVLWIPKKVQTIKAGAFADHYGKTRLTDVFFTGTIPPSYVDATAFSTSAYNMNGGGHAWDLVNEDGTADRNAYRQDADRNSWCTVLNYPAGCNDQMQYWDKENAYVAPTRTTPAHDVSGMSETQNLEYTPDGWENSPIKSQLAYGGWCYEGYPDVTLGQKKIWPSEGQVKGASKLAANGYLWNGNAMSQEQLNKKGLYMFVLASDDCPSDEIKGYENNLWYTICLPYDMSVSDIQKTFGDETQVCRLSRVERETTGENMGIRLYFRRSVMTTGGYGTSGSYSEIANEEYDNNATGIKAYYPYMIKPKGTTAYPSWEEEGGLIRTFPDYQQYYRPGAIRRDVMTAIKASGDTDPNTYTYTFVGSHENTYLLQYSYFLGSKKSEEGSQHRFFFYTGADAKNNWKAFAALIRPSHGALDKRDFFKGTSTVPSTQDKVRMVSLFGDDEEEEPTGIKDVDVEGDNNTDGKVFSLNGQYVGTSLDNLPKGIYLVNGKKYMVR